MEGNFLNNSLYEDLMYPEEVYPNQPDHEEPIISECHLTEKMHSFKSLESYDSMQDVPLEALPDYDKVLIPGKLPGDQPMLVNAKQARRILIMRQKKYKKMIEIMDQGVNIDPRSLMAQISTKTRKKDEVRQRVALNRKRVNGLFVNKKKELRLENGPSSFEYSYETETYEPD